MSHVAEGELHAWLDGALDQLGETRAAQVREHLRHCAACQESLIAEEAVRARATEVLALAAPRVSEMPPLESLMERARSAAPGIATEPGRMSSARRRLAWAASIVVALGAGWMARELGLHPMGAPAGTVEPAARVAATPPAPAAPGDASADAGAAAVEQTGDELAAAPSEAVGPDAPAQVASAPAGGPEAVGGLLDRVASAPVRAAESLEPEAPAHVAAVAPPPVVEPTVTSRPGTALAVAAVAQPGAPPAAPAAPEAAKAEASRVAEAPREQTGFTGSGGRASNAAERPAPGRQERAASSVVPESGAGAIGIQRARAEGVRSDVPNLFVEGRARGAADDQRGGARAPAVTEEADESEARDLIVSGLDVLRVHWTQVVPGQTGLRVLQRLPSGDTLEIRFVRSGGPAADAADPLAAVLSEVPEEGRSQVVQVHRDGWLVARARLSEPELAALLEGVGQDRR
jgi:hypothetical protein